MWIEVLANQAIYLLTASEQKEKAHEHDNLRRIMDIVTKHRNQLDANTHSILSQTLDDKLTGQITGGLTMTAELKANLERWQRALGLPAAV